MQARGHDRLVPITPAPTREAGAGASARRDRQSAHTCQTCTRRKVKCDRVLPVCRKCRKSRLECSYEKSPHSRSGISKALLGELARYKRLLHAHGLLPKAEDDFEAASSQSQGRFMTGHGKSLYIESFLWRDLDDSADQNALDEVAEGDAEDRDGCDGEGESRKSSRTDYKGDGAATGSWLDVPEISDPLSASFLGLMHSLYEYHPTHSDAVTLWRVHVDRVDPLCKVLHTPSVSEMIHQLSQNPGTMSKAEECLVFAIYHFSVYSLTDAECVSMLQRPRSVLLKQFHFAARQALVNASFLKTTQILVLQAFALLLAASRDYYDSHTYWILTGVAMRIAQRIGLHRDGEKLGLPPFDVEIRRRLFYVIVPLEGRASQMAGAATVLMPPAFWDTVRPRNIDDDQIWPGMSERPEERERATDMIFFLSRVIVGQTSVQLGALGVNRDLMPVKSREEAAQVVNSAENEIEEKFIRYCDVTNPLHFLSIGFVRSGVAAMRMRILLFEVKMQRASDQEMRDTMRFAEKILDTDTTIHAHVELAKFSWHTRVFFLWGMWEALIFLLDTLWKRDHLLTHAEKEATWSRMEKVYKNHSDMLDSSLALDVVLRRLTVKVWDSSNSGNRKEPEFITRLRRAVKQKQRPSDAKLGAVIDPSLSGLLDADMDEADWKFWENLILTQQCKED